MLLRSPYDVFMVCFIRRLPLLGSPPVNGVLLCHYV